MDKHKVRKSYSLDFEDEYKYYYVKMDSLYLENVGLIKDIIVGADQSGTIRGIIIFIADNKNLAANEIEKPFGKPALQSNSSIEGAAFSHKLFWITKLNLTIFLSTYANEPFKNISIHNTGLDEYPPYLYICGMIICNTPISF